MESADIYKLVQDRYGELADRSSTADQDRPEESVAKAFGYDASELSTIPQDANLGVGYGNPLAVANIREVSTYYYIINWTVVHAGSHTNLPISRAKQ